MYERKPQMKRKCNRDCERCIAHISDCAQHSMPTDETLDGLSIEEQMAYIGFMRGLEDYPHESD